MGKSSHIERKHYIKSIASKAKLRDLLADCNLTETDVRALTMYYVERNDIGYIADTLGWSYSAAQKHIANASKVLAELAKQVTGK
ncbi:MAG: hypothetical protein IJ334_05985 [Clostridia bacterium]|nr:hypothetical protein [Clostridia bacterium]